MRSCGAETDNLSSACEGSGLRKAAPVGQGFPGLSWAEELVGFFIERTCEDIIIGTIISNVYH